jgi:hypothetical protein
VTGFRDVPGGGSAGFIYNPATDVWLDVAPSLFTISSAVQLGLVDGIGDTASILRERFGTRAARDYTPRPAFLERASRVIGATLAESLVVESGGLVLH